MAIIYTKLKPYFLPLWVALKWAWANRKRVLGYGAGAILLCKWAFGYLSTDTLIELVQALAGIVNPITLF